MTEESQTTAEPAVNLSEEDKARLAAILGEPAAPVTKTGKDRVLVVPRHVFDIDGRQITENVVINGTAPEGFLRFIANFSTPVKIVQKDPKGGPSHAEVRDVPLNAPLPFDTIEEAFDNFDAVAKSTAEQYIETLRANHLRAQLAEGASGLAASGILKP